MRFRQSSLAKNETRPSVRSQWRSRNSSRAGLRPDSAAWRYLAMTALSLSLAPGVARDRHALGSHGQRAHESLLVRPVQLDDSSEARRCFRPRLSNPATASDVRSSRIAISERDIPCQ